ncbi:hypothetical protein KCP69_02595 [Salmonella enterica subsp. enterica]|nr:hypothetical protein KCP69_02595 [Salmonella enterica subsp. enterica]
MSECKRAKSPANLKAMMAAKRARNRRPDKRSVIRNQTTISERPAASVHSFATGFPDQSTLLQR